MNAEIIFSSSPYPTHSLPPTLRSYVHHLCAFVQVPPELAGPLVVTAASAGVQGVADVQSPFGGVIPTSLFCLVTPHSGDRVTHVMRKINAPFLAFEEGALGCSAMSKGEGRFVAHQMLVGQATEQGVIDLQSDGANSIYAALDEGHTFFKSLSIPAWCKRWDGDVVRHNTRTGGPILLRGKRAAMCVSVQEQVFKKIMKRHGEDLLTSGFMPRTLFAMPPSLQGLRNSYAMSAGLSVQEQEFSHRLRALLSKYAEKQGAGDTEREVIQLTQEARDHVWRFERDVERQLGPGGDLCDIPAFGSKAIENVVRLAAVFEYFDSGDLQVTFTAVDAAIAVVLWHLQEAKRAFGVVPPEILAGHHANILYRWLMHAVPYGVRQSEVLRTGPEVVRKKCHLEPALQHLQRCGLISIVRKGGATVILPHAYQAALTA